MIHVTCRTVLHADLPDVVVLDQLCFAGLWSEAAYRREVDSPNSDLLLLKTAPASSAESESLPTIMGLACTWAILEEAHITLLGIHPSYQRRGLGQWLLFTLLQAARDRGLTHATLEVRQSNRAAQQLYARFGFKVAGERRHYYADGENALILWLSGMQSSRFGETLNQQSDRLTQQLLRHQIQIVNALSCP